MYGFAKEAIIIMPKGESYFSKDDQWKANLNESVNKVISFVNKYVGAKACMVNSDEVAVDTFWGSSRVEWLSALPPEDVNFARRHCQGLKHMPDGKEYEDLYETVRKRYPVKMGLNIQQRFEIALKREKYAVNSLLKECKLVFTFENQNSPGFKVEKHLPKNRAVFIINPTNFMASVHYAGSPIDIVGFTQAQWTSKPVYQWEV